MPHYKDGSEAKVGDLVKGLSYDGTEIRGEVVDIFPGCDTCNMSIVTTNVVPVDQVFPGLAALVVKQEPRLAAVTGLGTYTVGEFEKIGG